MVQSPATRPRDENGRLQKMLTMDRMVEALREAGGGPVVPAELAKILDMDSRTVRAAYAQAVKKPYDLPIKGRKSDRVWIFWLEEENEGENKVYHNEYKDGMQLICNVCGHEFKKGDTCHCIDRMEMDNLEEGTINAMMQVCEKCLPKSLKNASWDLV